MKRIFLVFAFLIFLPAHTVVAQGSAISIISPSSTEYVQGVVSVTGISSVPGFVSSELSFAYPDDTTNTWFVIQTSKFPIQEGSLGQWDTTTLTDGNYVLRLRVSLEDGTMLETKVTDIRVRNYTPTPTPTPIPTGTPVEMLMVPSLPVPTLLPATVTPSFPSPTPPLANPIILRTSTIYASLGRGALVVAVLFLVFSLILRIRKD